MNNEAWNCPQCTYTNESGLQCAICGKERPHSLNGWKCKNCTFQNLTDQKSCTVCHNPRPYLSGHEINHNNHHHLDNYHNHRNHHNHHNLHEEDINHHHHEDHNPLLFENNNKTEMIQENADAFWICPDCTFANNENVNADRCYLCDGKRQQLSTGTTTMGGSYGDGDDDDDEDEEDEDNDNNNNHDMIINMDLPSDPQYEHFESVLNIIVAHAPNNRAAVTVLKSLNKITDRVSDEKPKYRVLDTRTRGVQTKLLGFEGSLEYLQLLGYSLDPTQTQLRCLKHPPQHILDRVKETIQIHLKNQRAKVSQNRKHRKNKQYHPQSPPPPPPQQQHQQYMIEPDVVDEKKQNDDYNDNDNDNDDDEDDDKDLKLDCGDFTLTQLVGLVTHETLDEDDTIRVLLLCHRCFSDSLELIEAIRKRFFVPPPEENVDNWTEEQIISWCQNTQRPIQNKCIQILCEWITGYFYVDFGLQPKVLSDLQKFTNQVYKCKYEADDGWYDSLATLLTSAIENGQQQLNINNINHMLQNKSIAIHPIIPIHDNHDEIDMKLINDILQINYDSMYDISKKQKKNKINIFKNNKDKQQQQQQQQQYDKNKKKIIYEYSAKEMAEQITLTDFEYFTAIHSREFLDKVWKGNKNQNKNPNHNELIDDHNHHNHHNQESMNDKKYYPNLKQMIDRFNKIHKYVIISIIYCHDLSSRVRILSHFIDTCLHLLELHNFFSLMAVFSALDSISVGKLKFMWLRLDNKYKSLLKNLSTVCNPNQNFKSLRKLMRRSFSSRYPTIPYIGVFLSDLTFVNEGAAKLVEGFINFKRFERFHERCKIVQSFQQISYDKLNKNEISSFIENDINIFNDKLNDKFVRSLVADSVKNDEKNATNSERQTIKKMSAKKKRGRKNNKKHENKKRFGWKK